MVKEGLWEDKWDSIAHFFARFHESVTFRTNIRGRFWCYGKLSHHLSPLCHTGAPGSSPSCHILRLKYPPAEPRERQMMAQINGFLLHIHTSRAPSHGPKQSTQLWRASSGQSTSGWKSSSSPCFLCRRFRYKNF